MTKKKISLYFLLLTMLVFFIASLTTGAWATTLTATGSCYNVNNEGLELKFSDYISDNDLIKYWNNQVLTTISLTDSKGNALAADGNILRMEVELAATSKRVQCTQQTSGVPGTASGNLLTDMFSCNDINNSAIDAIYIYYKPNSGITTDTKVTVTVTNADTTNSKTLVTGTAAITYPADVCARNTTSKVFLAGEYPFTINTDSSCKTVTSATDENKVGNTNVLDFYENSSSPFAIVNYMVSTTNSSGTSTDTLDYSRFQMIGSPLTTAFGYVVTYYFYDVNGSASSTSPKPEKPGATGVKEYSLEFTHYATDTSTTLKRTAESDDIKNVSSAKLPLTLNGGTIKFFDTSTTTTNPPSYTLTTFPTNVSLTFTLYYQNLTGTQGVDNSTFHFDRTMDITFGKYCSTPDSWTSASVIAATASSKYNVCNSTAQSFYIPLLDQGGNGIKKCTNPAAQRYTPPLTTQGALNCINYAPQDSTTRPSSTESLFFVTRKCTDATCAYQNGTSAYISGLHYSDGWVSSNSTGTNWVFSTTTSRFTFYYWENTAAGYQFALTGIDFVAQEAGTYYIRGFYPYYQDGIDNGNWGTAPFTMYVTIPASSATTSCSSPATDGHYRAYSDGCKEDYETQEVQFTAIDSKYGFIDNYSNALMKFPLSSEYSVLPTPIKMESLECSWQALSDGASSYGGYCSAGEIAVPAHMRVIVTSGKFYAIGAPDNSQSDKYEITYERPETHNALSMFVYFAKKECAPEAVIPNTGLSLRSDPALLSPSEDTDFVFTGNKLQIPSIGLGMEYPVDIVHVYYLNGAYENGWDLKTLGGYVGELEGGAYLPNPGNSVLTGHYYSKGVFVNLPNVKEGDEIYILGNDGIKYVYHVTERLYEDPKNVYSMFQGSGDRSLALVTCDNYDLTTNTYGRRMVIRATLDHTEAIQ